MSRIAFTVAQPRATALRAINYSPLAERFWARGRSRIHRLRDLVLPFGASYGAVFTRKDCSPRYGVELLSQVDMFTAEPACRVIRRDSMPQPEQHVVSRGQILIAGAGQTGESALFGRAMIADSRLSGKYLGPHIVSLSMPQQHEDLSLYLYAFLLSGVGLELIRSTAYGTSVPSIRLDLLGNLPVPVPSDELRTEAARLIRDAMLARERFAAELAAVRAPIDALEIVQQALAACAERRPQVGSTAGPFRTLSAWNHVSTGSASGLLQEAWRTRLGDVVESDGIFKGLRFARIPCESPYGIDLLSQRDVFLIRPFSQRVLHPGFDERWLFAPEGSLLVGGAGTLGEGEIFGRTVYVSADASRLAVTEDMLRVQPDRHAAPLVYAFLSTLVGKRLLRSTAVGTKILRMRPDLLRELPIPDVDGETISLISGHLSAAMRARDEANRAESEAVRLIESEVVSPWLS